MLYLSYYFYISILMLNISSLKNISILPLYLLTIFFILYNPYPLPVPLVENLILDIFGTISSVKLLTLLTIFIMCFPFLYVVKISMYFFSLLLAASIALFNKLLNTTVSSLSSNCISSN